MGHGAPILDISSLAEVVSFSAGQTDAAENQGSATEQTLDLSPKVRLYFERQGLAVGADHSCAVTKDKKILCWGNNYNGELGDDSNTQRNHPVYVIDGDGSAAHLTDIIEIAAGEKHTCALKSSGEVLCWGNGSSGRQLGNGETASRDHPVYVKESETNSTSNLSGIIQITGGRSHTCALNEGGKVLCWGRDYSGQLGNGDPRSRVMKITRFMSMKVKAALTI